MVQMEMLKITKFQFPCCKTWVSNSFHYYHYGGPQTAHCNIYLFILFDLYLTRFVSSKHILIYDNDLAEKQQTQEQERARQASADTQTTNSTGRVRG